MNEGKVWPKINVKKSKINIVSAYKEEFNQSKPQFWLLVTLPLVAIAVSGVILQISIVSGMLDLALKCVSSIEFLVNIGLLLYGIFMLATISPVVAGLAYWGLGKVVTKVGEYILKAVIGLSVISFICSVLVLIVSVVC